MVSMKGHVMPIKISDALLSQMGCIECASNLKSAENGGLLCVQCGRVYPQMEPGYFDFMVSPVDKAADEKELASWDTHWHNVKDLDNYLVSNETEYFNEIVPAIFQGKIIVVVGCGTGKNIEKYLAERPKAIIMSDISHSIVQAVRNWRHACDNYKDVEVLFLRSDINKMPFVGGRIPMIYVSCGLYNILEDQSRCIRESMRFTDHIFLLFNSPNNFFGKIYYALNPVRAIMKIVIPWNTVRSSFSRIISYIAYPFVIILISFVSEEVRKGFSRKALEFLINDWIFMSPKGIAYDASYYKAIERGLFDCTVLEKTISRIVYYGRIQ